MLLSILSSFCFSWLAASQVTGAFFHLDRLTAGGDRLAPLLAGWIAAGCVPMLTMNMFLAGQDAWHHQVRWARHFYDC